MGDWSASWDLLCAVSTGSDMQHFGKSCNIAAQIRAADHKPSCKATPSVYDQHCNLSSPPQFPFTFFMATSGAISRGNCRPGGVLKRKAMMRKQGGGTPTFQRTKILCVCVCVSQSFYMATCMYCGLDCNSHWPAEAHCISM